MVIDFWPHLLVKANNVVQKRRSLCHQIFIKSGDGIHTVVQCAIDCYQKKNEPAVRVGWPWSRFVALCFMHAKRFQVLHLIAVVAQMNISGIKAPSQPEGSKKLSAACHQLLFSQVVVANQAIDKELTPPSVHIDFSRQKQWPQPRYKTDRQNLIFRYNNPLNYIHERPIGKSLQTKEPR